MLGILFLLTSVLLGTLVSGLLIGSDEKTERNFWVFWALAFGSGTVLLSWFVYGIAWYLHVSRGVAQPLGAADAIGIVTALLICGIVFFLKKRKGTLVSFFRIHPSDMRHFKKEVILFAVLFIFISWTMQYVFQVKGDTLYSGLTVFSDYAPHTAMIRSFSLGANYPTQYPHFGGEDIKYHFMFQFLVGNLEYLGLRIDLAYNLPSALSLAGFLMILSQFVRKFTKAFGAQVLTCVLFFFRSGTAFFQFVWEHIKAGDLWATLAQNTVFIGYTPNENWGLWNYNVYLNQRHLCLGLLVAAAVIWVFMDWLQAGTSHEEKGLRWFGNRLFTAEAWESRDATRAVIAGVTLGLFSFWNGAAVIGALLILCGYAVFSDGKLDYVIMASMTILLAEMQTKLFIKGEGFTPGVLWGFISEDKSLGGILWYVIRISGFSILGILVLMPALKRMERAAAAAFMFPFVFAFVGTLTPDVTVNHKYIMMTVAFLAVFWGVTLWELFTSRWTGKLLAVVLAVCLTATGLYDFVIIVRDNDKNHRVGVNLTSDVTAYLAENVTTDKLVLTPQYSISEVTMSGVMMYLGWPYYPWSAGYDTYYRGDQQTIMYTTEDPDQLRTLIWEENISYIVYEDGMTIGEYPAREDTIAEVFPLVYTSENGRIRIYEVG